MNNLLDKSLKQLNKGLKNKDFSCLDLTKQAINASKEIKSSNTYITLVDEKKLLKKAKQKDKDGIVDKSILDGIPFSMKDIYVTSGVKTTAGSNVLQNYKQPTMPLFIKKL